MGNIGVSLISDEFLEELSKLVEIPISYFEIEPLKFSENAHLNHIWKIEPKVEVDFSIWDW